MTKYFWLCIFLAACAAPLAQEKSVLTTPAASKVITEYEIAEFRLARLPDWVVEITYVDNLGGIFIDRHQGVTHETSNPQGADTLIIALNKANLSTQSLERRLLMHLIAEGKIPAASVTGAPR